MSILIDLLPTRDICSANRYALRDAFSSRPAEKMHLLYTKGMPSTSMGFSAQKPHGLHKGLLLAAGLHFTAQKIMHNSLKDCFYNSRPGLLTDNIEGGLGSLSQW